MFSFCYFSVRIKIQCRSHRTINILHFNSFFPFFSNNLYYYCGCSFAAIFCMYSLMYMPLNFEWRIQIQMQCGKKKKKKTRKWRELSRYWRMNANVENQTIKMKENSNLVEQRQFLTNSHTICLILSNDSRYFVRYF